MPKIPNMVVDRIYRDALHHVKMARVRCAQVGAGTGEIKTLEEHEAFADLVLECAKMVNLFPLSRAEELQNVKLDRERLMEEIELISDEGAVRRRARTA